MSGAVRIVSADGMVSEHLGDSALLPPIPRVGDLVVAVAGARPALVRSVVFGFDGGSWSVEVHLYPPDEGPALAEPKSEEQVAQAEEDRRELHETRRRTGRRGTIARELLHGLAVFAMFALGWVLLTLAQAGG